MIRCCSVVLAASVANGSGLELVVSDTGVGMDEEGVATAMSEFGQVKCVHARTEVGTGLGLPLTRTLVAMHGGMFAIDSEKGRGTTVRVTLPSDRILAQG